MHTSSTAGRQRSNVRWMRPAFQVFMGLVGLGAGWASASYCYEQTVSWELSVFTFALVSYAVGSAVPNILTKPRKIERTIYFALFPAAGTAALSLSYWAWGQLWLSLILGLGVAGLVQTLVAWILFPGIQAEEEAGGGFESWLHTQSWQAPGPHDLIPGWTRDKERESSHNSINSESKF